MPAVVETYALAKRFADLTAVEDVSLQVGEGEMFGLVGPDGAGKTTVIRMLCGILAPSSGTATVLGADVVKEPDRVKKEIGYLSQRFSLYGDLTIDENIEFFAEINRVHEYRQRREELLEFTRLTPFRDRLADKLSGGMRQKLALACTLIHTPKIIFLDEPTTGVDPVSRRDFWKILQRLLGDGITIIMSTPYLDEAERCSHVALMNKGRVMTSDTPPSIKKLMTGDILEIVCDRVREASALLKSHPAVTDVQTFGDRLHILVRDLARDRTALASTLASAGITIAQIRSVSPSLENAFIHLLTAPATASPRAAEEETP
jgi:ABC-2 type transport system ATP-binding protein